MNKSAALSHMKTAQHTQLALILNKQTPKTLSNLINSHPLFSAGVAAQAASDVFQFYELLSVPAHELRACDSQCALYEKLCVI